MLVFFLAMGCANEWNALDADGDGWTVAAGDCWDETALHGGLEGSEIHPEAPDVPYDGVDADCAGDDDFDHDGDGYVTSVWKDAVTEGVPSSLPGGDCWDDRDEIEQEFGALPGFPQLAAADVHPGARDAWYDGIDADCDGADDFDQDGDGHASSFHRDGASTFGDDCFDDDDDAFENPKGLDPAEVHPGAFDKCYDATDADCDGKSDWDCDHDDFLVDEDCDDENAGAHPGAIEDWYNGIDEDCDGNDGDKDYDGFLALDYPGSVKAPVKAPGIQEGDCWDDPEEPHEPLNGLPELDPADVHPFASETWYDGIDQDCDDPQDFDQDVDGYDAAGMDGSKGLPDCVDTDAKINPGSDETCTTLYDDDCDGDNNDENADACQPFFDDEDGDMYGAVGVAAKCTCGYPPWSASDDTDCDDLHDTINPGETEIVDNATDEDCSGGEACYVDDDGDSFYPDATPIESKDLDCTDDGEGGAGTREGDCNDDDPVTNPDADDSLYCNDGIDQNCDGSSDPCALTGSSVAIATLAGASLLGETGDGFGYAIAEGALGGDGTIDVVISANPGSTVYGFLGPLSGLDVASSTREFEIASSDIDFGESLAADGDLDDDGVNDVAIGSPFAPTEGAAFVFFGPLSGSYTDADANVLLVGDSSDDQLGVSLATGDWNDDGLDDLAIGANSDDSGGTRSGSLWVLFGPLSAVASPIDPDLKKDGASMDDHATRSLASGDVNADGLDDIAIGVPGSDLGATNAGGAYVVLGPISADTDLESSAAYEMYADDVPDGDAGTAMALADFDDSGADDVVIGAPDAALAYLVTEDQLASSSAFDLTDASATISGPPSGDAGTAVGSARDFDNDGRADLFVGAPGNEHVAIFYAPPSGTVLLSDADLVLGTKGDGIGSAARSVGDQDGDDIDDLMVSAPNISGEGTAWLVFGAGM